MAVEHWHPETGGTLTSHATGFVQSQGNTGPDMVWHTSTQTQLSTAQAVCPFSSYLQLACVSPQGGYALYDHTSFIITSSWCIWNVYIHPYIHLHSEFCRRSLHGMNFFSCGSVADRLRAQMCGWWRLQRQLKWHWKLFRMQLQLQSHDRRHSFSLHLMFNATWNVITSCSLLELNLWTDVLEHDLMTQVANETTVFMESLDESTHTTENYSSEVGRIWLLCGLCLITGLAILALMDVVWALLWAWMSWHVITLSKVRESILY